MGFQFCTVNELVNNKPVELPVANEVDLRNMSSIETVFPLRELLEGQQPDQTTADLFSNTDVWYEPHRPLPALLPVSDRNTHSHG